MVVRLRWVTRYSCSGARISTTANLMQAKGATLERFDHVYRVGSGIATVWERI